MKVDRIPIQPGRQHENNAALREGVEGKRCTFHGMAEYAMSDDIQPFLHVEEHVIGFEVYEDGSLNLYVHTPDCEAAIAYIRIRPSKEILV